MHDECMSRSESHERAASGPSLFFFLKKMGRDPRRGPSSISFFLFFKVFFNLQARATSDRSRQFRRQCKNDTSVWLYKWRSLEKFLRLTQKIPISLSGAKVEEHRDAANLEWSQEPRHKGQSPRSKAHDDQVVNVEALRSVQSDNGATQALRVEAFRTWLAACCSTRIYPHLLFFS